MIAAKELPAAYKAWNAQWRAPFGRRWPLRQTFERSAIATRYRGMFAAQRNSGTRRFEYPWAHGEVTAEGRPSLRIVEVGGGLSGLQFVLAREGHHVINVDPGQPQLKWGDTYRTDHERLCHAFGADVRLIATTLGEAQLPPGQTDVLLCVSVLEHLPPAAVTEFAHHALRILRPGGLAVLSVDLFLNLAPFSRRTENHWGRNIDIHHLLEESGLELIKGDREVLNGFPEFQADRVLERLDGYLLSPNYPCLAQCLVARRPVTAS